MNIVGGLARTLQLRSGSVRTRVLPLHENVSKAKLPNTSSALSCINVAGTVLVMAVKTQIVKIKEVFSLNSDSLGSL